MGQAQKRHTKSNLKGQRPNHNGVSKSWVHSNQYTRFFWVVSQYESKFWKAFRVVSGFEWKPWKLLSHESIWIEIMESHLGQESIWINSWKPLWVMSWIGIKTFWSLVESNRTSLSRTHVCVKHMGRKKRHTHLQSPLGKTGQNRLGPWLTFDGVKRYSKLAYVKNSPPPIPPKNSHYRHEWGQSRSVTSDDLPKVNIQCEASDVIIFSYKWRKMFPFQSIVKT